MNSDELLLPWFRRLAARIPGLTLFDSHTHLGDRDPDGTHLALEGLLEALSLTDAHAVTFPLMDPGGYHEANTAVIAAAAASGGRLVGFCRVDPRENPGAELRRCFAEGARGVKLHPRGRPCLARERRAGRVSSRA